MDLAPKIKKSTIYSGGRLATTLVAIIIVNWFFDTIDINLYFHTLLAWLDESFADKSVLLSHPTTAHRCVSSNQRPGSRF